MKQIIALLCLTLTALLPGCGSSGKPADQTAPPKLVIFCGGGIRPPMEELKVAFEKEYSCKLEVNYAGSGTLLGKLMTGSKADIYIPGDISFIEKARGKNLITNHKVTAWLAPVLAVAVGNPKDIKGLKDLAREELKVGLGRPEVCAVGNVARDLLTAAGLSARIKPDFEGLTVNALANQLKLKALDAAIIWDATARQYPDSLEIVKIKDADFHAVPFAVSSLKGASNADLAAKFIDFAAGSQGAAIFRKNHYQVPGKNMRVSCGGSMRLATEELIKLFESKTGSKVLADYGGSGTILLQLQESKEGDIYICHDPYAYECQKRKLYTKGHTIAYLDICLAVKKGNPKNIKGLKDLLRKDINAGLSHRKYSTRGKILWEILKKNNMAEAIEKRQFFEDRKHSLVNQLLVGTVDVVTLWDAPARFMKEVEAIPIAKEHKIDSITSATTGVTFDTRKIKVSVVRLSISKEPLLAAQFARVCTSPAGRKILAKHKFNLPEAGK
jgi:molybdate transport system substrate-binding protein